MLFAERFSPCLIVPMEFPIRSPIFFYYMREVSVNYYTTKFSHTSSVRYFTSTFRP